MRLRLLFLFLYVGIQLSFAQQNFIAQLQHYHQAKPSSSLFVHFDKNVYSNNETVWFTAYLIKESSISANKHQVLSLSLLRDVDSTIILNNKFIMDKGISFGSLTIPDSISTGNYHLIAHTNVLVSGKPDAIFLQAITIKTNLDPAFKASMKLVDSANEQRKTNQILLSTTSKSGYFLPKPTNVSYKYNHIFKNEKTDASGQLMINLPILNNASDPNLYVKLSNQKDSTFLSMTLAQKTSKGIVHFYPEGGNMVENLSTIIGWEVKDQQKNPIAAIGFLYKNNQIIDTITTGAYGLGNFRLIPEKDAKYTVRLKHSNLVDSTYLLPNTIADGITLTLPNAVVEDTLRVHIRSHSPRQLILRVHNFRESFIDVKFDMNYPIKAIRIPLNEVPKGLVTFTICDSLERPLAERMFFAHYESKNKISINLNKKEFKQREKVNLKINLDAVEENAVVSIAVVQDNRMELKKMTDIESYNYLNTELNELPVHTEGNYFKDKDYLEQVLLIKGWRKYTWQDVYLAQNDTIKPQLDTLKISGQVLKANKKLNKEVVLGTLGSSTMNLINTSASGSFELSNDQQLVEPGKKIYLFVNEKNKYSFTIDLDDGYKRMLKKLIPSIPIRHFFSSSSLSNNESLVLKSNEKEIRLKEVEIKKNKDNSFYASKGKGLVFGRNECGDYVCAYNILNCRNHSEGTLPVTGQSYRTGEGSSTTYYSGCITLSAEEKSTIFPFSGIQLHKEFYHNDYKDLQEPAFFSTIYWNYATLLTANKDTELSFYTSDITGRFRIVVQGITTKDVVHAEQFFEVKK